MGLRFLHKSTKGFTKRVTNIVLATPTRIMEVFGSCLKANDECPISATPGLWQLAVKYGNKGEKGIPGVSAYELAVNNGFKGSEKEYLASIRRGINS